MATAVASASSQTYGRPVRPIGSAATDLTEQAADRVYARWRAGSGFLDAELGDDVNAPSAHEPVIVRISFGAYLRGMWNLLWTALLYPTKTTEIDWLTGRVVRHF